MKSHYFYPMLMMFVVILSSQERENINLPNFVAVSKPLTGAIGWAFNEENGLWYSNKNVIADRENADPLYDSPNFTQINIAEYKCKNKKYYVLLFQQNGTTYKYPSIHQGMYSIKITAAILLTESEYLKIKNFVYDQSGENLLFETRKYVEIDDQYESLGGEHIYNQHNLLSKIYSKAKGENSIPFLFRINSQKTKNGDVVRFIVPTIYLDFSPPSENEYFEVPFKEFIRLFDLSETNKFQLL